LRSDWLNRRFKQLARQAGLPDGVRVYDLRHGWATAALRASVHPKLVQEVMRHSSNSTNADWYAAHRRDHGSMPESVPAATEQRVRVPARPRQGESPT
jgi:integrase